MLTWWIRLWKRLTRFPCSDGEVNCDPRMCARERAWTDLYLAHDAKWKSRYDTNERPLKYIRWSCSIISFLECGVYRVLGPEKWNSRERWPYFQRRKIILHELLIIYNIVTLAHTAYENDEKEALSFWRQAPRTFATDRLVHIIILCIRCSFPS